MATAEIEYLQNVLGVRAVMIPEALVVKPSLQFVFTHEISDAEKSLAIKMATAMGFESYNTIVITDNFDLLDAYQWSAGHKVVCFSDDKMSLQNELLEFGEVLDADFGSVIQTHDISKLSDSSHAYVQQMKKQTWTHMKLLM